MNKSKFPDYHQQVFKKNEKVLQVATEKICKFLKIEAKVPKLILKYNQGPTGQTKIVDGIKQAIILRPKKSLQKYGQPELPPEIIIHELTHILEDKFLELPPDTKRKTDTAVYLSDGFANFMATEDVAGIYQKLNLKPRKNIQARIKKTIKSDPEMGKFLIEFIDINKLFSVRQYDLEKNDPTATPKLSAKELVPYWIGASLIKFIFNKKGIKAIKRIMRKTQVNKKYAYGWIVDTPTQKQLASEEKRVRYIFIKSIENEFGDSNKFQKDWKNFVLENNFY